MLFRLFIIITYLTIFLTPSQAAVRGVLGVAASGPANTLGLNLIGAWKLNDNTPGVCTTCWLDSSVNNLDMDARDLADHQTGIVDRNGLATAAMHVTTDFVNPGNQNTGVLSVTGSVTTQNLAHTVSVWIKPTIGGSGDGGIFFSDVRAAGNSFRARLDCTLGFINYIVETVTAGRVTITSNSTITENVWTNIIAVYTGSQQQIYINNVLDKSAALTGSLLINPSNPPLFGISIGSVGATSSSSNAFLGDVDDVLYWDKALNSDERTLVFGLGSNFGGIIDFD